MLGEGGKECSNEKEREQDKEEAEKGGWKGQWEEWQGKEGERKERERRREGREEGQTERDSETHHATDNKRSKARRGVSNWKAASLSRTEERAPSSALNRAVVVCIAIAPRASEERPEGGRVEGS